MTTHEQRSKILDFYQNMESNRQRPARFGLPPPPLRQQKGPPMTLQLEVGKTYRTRGGALAKILHKLSNNQSDPYLGITEFNTPHENARRWNPDGTFINAHHESHLDIIAEAKLWDGWEIDKPVWVRDHITEKWVPRHFAGERNGRPTAWAAGYTSHSQRGHGPVLWHFVTDVNPYKD